MTAINIGEEDGPGGPRRVTKQGNNDYIGYLYQGNVWRMVGRNINGDEDWRRAPLGSVQDSRSWLSWDNWFSSQDDLGSLVTKPPWERNVPAPVVRPPAPAPQQAPPPQAPANQSPSSCPGSGESQIGSVDRWGAPILPTDLQLGAQQPITTDAFANFSNLGASVGDFGTFGVTSWLRNDLGYDSAVDYNSFAYQAGTWGMTIVTAPATVRGAWNIAKGGWNVAKWGWKSGSGLVRGLLGATTPTGPNLQWHHIWPRQFGLPPEWFRNLFPGRGQVRLPTGVGQIHTNITNMWENLLPWRGGPYSEGQITAALVQILKQFPLNGFPYR